MARSWGFSHEEFRWWLSRSLFEGANQRAMQEIQKMWNDVDIFMRYSWDIFMRYWWGYRCKWDASGFFHQKGLAWPEWLDGESTSCSFIPNEQWLPRGCHPCWLMIRSGMKNYPPYLGDYDPRWSKNGGIPRDPARILAGMMLRDFTWPLLKCLFIV